jgi:A/G-specific adenine glycosylase
VAELARVRHTYSHFGIHMHVYICHSQEVPAGLTQPHRWIRPDELADYPFPKANHKFFARLKDWWAEHPEIHSAR